MVFPSVLSRVTAGPSARGAARWWAAAVLGSVHASRAQAGPGKMRGNAEDYETIMNM